MTPEQRTFIAEAIGRCRVIENDVAALRISLERLLTASCVGPDANEAARENGAALDVDPRLRGFTPESFKGCRTTQACVYLVDDAHPGISPHEIAWILRKLGLSDTITPASASSMRSRRPRG